MPMNIIALCAAACAVNVHGESRSPGVIEGSLPPMKTLAHPSSASNHCLTLDVTHVPAFSGLSSFTSRAKVAPVPVGRRSTDASLRTAEASRTAVGRSSSLKMALVGKEAGGRPLKVAIAGGGVGGPATVEIFEVELWDEAGSGVGLC